MLTYVAGKYSSPDGLQKWSNVVAADEAGRQVMAAGHVPFIPHNNSCDWEHDDRFKAMTPDDWLTKVCFPILAKCEVALFIEGWKESYGARLEHQYCELNNIPIVYSVEELREKFKP